ncbi:crossover junction endodeoxyribonuclease RuvC [Candidatus Daviesbacteria bacterium]|nr:crossover junction endodeoxyribonuclease RuvC [Candidatus Daviesbacteria bacterium]
MIILGIDPGTATTGYGVIKVPDDILGREFEYGLELMDYGNIFTDKEMVMGKRLWELARKLDDLIKRYKPEQMAVEMLFFGANVKTAISVGQARGIVLMCAAKNGVSISEYAGPQMKLMVTGSGKATKEQVHFAVRKWLSKSSSRRRNRLPTKKGGHLDDATDALAIAICHVLKMVAK